MHLHEILLYNNNYYKPGSNFTSIIIMYTCVMFIGGNGGGADIAPATVAYWTGVSAGGGEAG